MNQCRLSDTAWSNYQDHRAWSSCMHSFSGRTNGFQDSIKGFQEPWMLNEAMLLKVLLSCVWRSQKERPIKKCRLLSRQYLLILCQQLQLLVHEGILLNTSSLSCCFGCSSCDATDPEAWCWLLSSELERDISGAAPSL